MKKIKKSKKSWAWKIVVGVVVVCVVGVATCFVRGTLRWIDIIGGIADQTSWRVVMGEIYSEVSVSDDGRWFLVPEARVKFPFFVAEDMNTNLRYNYMAYGTSLDKDDPARGFEIKFTYDLLDNQIFEHYPEGCVSPFVLFYGGAGWEDEGWDLGDDYKIVTDVRLADGRVVQIWRKYAGGCEELKVREGALRTFEILESQLRRARSY